MSTTYEKRRAKEAALEARWAEIGPRIVQVMADEGLDREPLHDGWTVKRNGYFFRFSAVKSGSVSMSVKPPQVAGYGGRRAGAVSASLCVNDKVNAITAGMPESPTCHADASRDPETMVREFVKKLTPHAHTLADWVATQRAAAESLANGAEQALTALRSAGLVVRKHGEASDGHRLTVCVKMPAGYPAPGGYVHECFVEGLSDGADKWNGALNLRSVPFDRMVEILKIVTAP